MPTRPTLRTGSRRRLASALLPVALLLAACTGGGDGKAPVPGSSSSIASAAATTGSSGGSTTDGTGDAVDAADSVAGRSGTYSVVPPVGWGEATEQAGKLPGVDLVLLSSAKVAGFNSNFIVHLGPGDPAGLEAELQKGREQMAAAGRVVSDAPATTVAGAPATGFTTSLTQQGVKVVARTYGLHRKGRIYLLTFSSSQAARGIAASDLQAILDSWTWT